MQRARHWPARRARRRPYRRNADDRATEPVAAFDGILRGGAQTSTGGLLHARGDKRQTLEVAAIRQTGGQVESSGYYEMGPDMKLQRKDEPAQLAGMHASVAIPNAAVSIDAASVLSVDDAGNRFRLPKGRLDLAADRRAGGGDDRASLSGWISGVLVARRVRRQHHGNGVGGL